MTEKIRNTNIRLKGKILDLLNRICETGRSSVEKHCAIQRGSVFTTAQVVLVTRPSVAATVLISAYNWREIMLCGIEPRFSRHVVHVCIKWLAVEVEERYFEMEQSATACNLFQRRRIVYKKKETLEENKPLQYSTCAEHRERCGVEQDAAPWNGGGWEGDTFCRNKPYFRRQCLVTPRAPHTLRRCLKCTEGLHEKSMKFCKNKNIFPQRSNRGLNPRLNPPLV
jgi:hypothetical protein